jgi:hypothetical protein
LSRFIDRNPLGVEASTGSVESLAYSPDRQAVPKIRIFWLGLVATRWRMLAMRKSMQPLISAAFLLVLIPGTAPAQEKFGRSAIYLERNATDEDVEVRFEVRGAADGLATLQVTSPDGRTVIDFRTPQSRLGIRHLDLESPEPRDDGRLQADFPAGTYRFAGSTVGGTELRGEATLSHAFPPATSILAPGPGQSNVPTSGLRIRWTPVDGVAAYIVVIEEEDTEREMRVQLPGTAPAFAIPVGFLLPGKEYKLAIGTVSQEGNRSFVETSFETGVSGRRRRDVPD